MMDPLRTAGIWLSVGAGHVALLVAALGGGGAQAPSDGGWLTLVLVAPESSPLAVSHAAPISVAESGPASHPVIVPVPVASRATVASAGPLVHPSSVVADVMGEPPRFVDRVEPRYPRGARLAGVEGVVRLRLRVGADGALSRVDVVDGSGDASLDRAAVEAATASTYRPARVGGRATESEVESTYRFELR